MLVTRATSIISDSRRDADKYYKLLLAIESATKKIGALEKTGRVSIDEVLEGLLPDLIDALDAAQAFVAVYQTDDKDQVKGFSLVATHPKMMGASDSFLPWSKLLDQVLSDGRARVVEPFEDAPKKLIRGLEICNATTAILVRITRNPTSSGCRSSAAPGPTPSALPMSPGKPMRRARIQTRLPAAP